MRLVEVEWIDSYSGDHEWFDARRAPTGIKFPQMRTAGYVVFENIMGITLAMAYSTDPDQLHSLFTIPVGCITKITDIKHG